MVLLLRIDRNSVSPCPGRRRPRASTATVCIYSVSMYSVRTSTGRRSFAFHEPSIWNSLLSTLQDISLSLRAFKGGKRRISSVVNNNEHHPALMGRLVIVAPPINVQT